VGTVIRFDRETGLGDVALDGGGEVPFHATALMDGTRDVQEGRRVVVTVGATHGGHRECREVLGL
jgi:cold shock CspA family protein